MTKRYEQLIETYEDRLAGATRSFNRLGNGKLLLIAALAVLLYQIWSNRAAGPPPGLLVAAGVLFAALVAIWIYHIRVHRRMRRFRAVIDTARRYPDRAAGRWESLPDDGAAFLTAAHPYGADLDIVGERSLYRMLCVAHTVHGRRRLAADLLEPVYDREEIAARQCAVEELAADPEFAVLLECDAAQAGGETDILKVLETLRAPAGAVSPAVRLLLRWVPLGITAFFAAAMWAGGTALRLAAVVLLAAQAVFWAAGYARVGQALSGALAAPHLFRHYAAAMERVAAREFDAPLLREIRAQLAEGGDSAVAAVRRLDAIVGWIQLRHSGLLYFLANVFLLWDYRCLLSLEGWKSRHGPHCAGWFERLGELESLLSLSVLNNVCEGTCLPEIESAPGVAEARELGHPLLPNGARVRNALALRGNLLIISGSNMSGKTTYLRTVGVNLVLARAGGRVCAAAMRCSLFHLRSSLRIADNLGEGVSTFYAELRQVAAIVREAREREDLFFLIDELFRGTNSEDRLFGGRAVIEELARRPCCGLITTHDLSLCDLEQAHPSIRNYSFSEEYEGDRMHFSYRMRPGRARTTNARFLMRQVGILE